MRHRSPRAAIRNGIGLVHQHFKLVPSFTVSENLFLAAGRHRGLRFDAATVRREAAALSAGHGLEIDPDAVVGRLPLAAQQRVEILKALYQNARVLVLDEPTTVLSPTEVDTLYRVVGRIAAEGRAVILITHRLEEVFAACDRVTVLRHGRVVGSGRVADLERGEVARLIVGREPPRVERSVRPAGAGDPLLELRRVRVAAGPGTTGLADFDLTVRAGEVLGIAGVEGNGQRELVEVAAGLRRPDAGEVIVGGEPQRDAGRRRFAEWGVSLIPEDRQAEGLVLDLEVGENLVLDRIYRAPYSTPLFLRRRVIAAAAEALVTRFGIRAPGIWTRTRTLSGGNQQKVVLARALRDAPRLVVAHQPTRGLDLAATADVLDRLVQAAREGTGVLLVSSNLDEVLATADRVAVLYRGAVAGELAAGGVTREAMARLMTGAAGVAG